MSLLSNVSTYSTYSTSSTVTNTLFEVGSLAVLKGLKNKPEKNGKIVKIKSTLDPKTNRYNVIVLKTREYAQIKPINLRRYRPKFNKFEIFNRKHTSTAKFFAAKLLKYNENQINMKLLSDIQKVFEGNSIYINDFFSKRDDYTIFKILKKERESGKLDAMLFNDYKQLPRGYILKRTETYYKVVKLLVEYFDVELNASTINYYKDGNAKIGFHRDRVTNKGCVTIGASFGAVRTLQFLHIKSEQIFGIPQTNNGLFAFNHVVNSRFKHGIQKTKQSIGERFSIIVFGKRNSTSDKLQENIMV